MLVKGPLMNQFVSVCMHKSALLVEEETTWIHNSCHLRWRFVFQLSLRALVDGMLYDYFKLIYFIW